MDLIRVYHKLWLLKPINPNTGAWNPWYNRCFGLVIRAETASQARAYAAAAAQAEGSDCWLDSKQSSCEELTQEGRPGVILTDIADA